MLSKLLKYEFRATGRIMLPVYALLLVTAGGTSVTGSLMGRYPESTVLSIFRTLFMTLFAFTTFGVLLLTLVLMVYRFYKNLMTDEGYLMFTLPVSRSQLIWSKLIVSMAWGILSAVLAALEEKLNDWAAGSGGLLLSYDRDRYLFVFEEKDYGGYTESKFDVLEKVRQLSLIHI